MRRGELKGPRSLARAGAMGIVALAVAVAAVGMDRPAVAQAKTRKAGKTDVKVDKRAFLGVSTQKLTDEIRDGLGIDVDHGVVINEVYDDTAADKAGLEEGDVIVKFNGTAVRSPRHLGRLVRKVKPGTEVEVEVVRDDARRTIEVTLGERPDGPALGFMSPEAFDEMGRRTRAFVAALRPYRLGVQVTDLNEDLAPYFGVKEDDGLLVLDVIDDSMAEEAGVKAGDVIVGVEGNEIHSVGDIHEALSDAEEGDKIEITVVRKKKKVKLEGEMGENELHAWYGARDRRRAPRSRRVEVHREVRDDVRRELRELRREIDELRKEIRKSKRRH